jgi:hypothetical protein
MADTNKRIDDVPYASGFWQGLVDYLKEQPGRALSALPELLHGATDVINPVSYVEGAKSLFNTGKAYADIASNRPPLNANTLKEVAKEYDLSDPKSGLYRTITNPRFIGNALLGPKVAAGAKAAVAEATPVIKQMIAESGSGPALPAKVPFPKIDYKGLSPEQAAARLRQAEAEFSREVEPVVPREPRVAPKGKVRTKPNPDFQKEEMYQHGGKEPGQSIADELAPPLNFNDLSVEDIIKHLNRLDEGLPAPIPDVGPFKPVRVQQPMSRVRSVAPNEEMGQVGGGEPGIESADDAAKSVQDIVKQLQGGATGKVGLRELRKALPGGSMSPEMPLTPGELALAKLQRGRGRVRTTRAVAPPGEERFQFGAEEPGIESAEDVLKFPTKQSVTTDLGETPREKFLYDDHAFRMKHGEPGEGPITAESIKDAREMWKSHGKLLEGFKNDKNAGIAELFGNKLKAYEDYGKLKQGTAVALPPTKPKFGLIRGGSKEPINVRDLIQRAILKDLSGEDR